MNGNKMQKEKKWTLPSKKCVDDIFFEQLKRESASRLSTSLFGSWVVDWENEEQTLQKWFAQDLPYIKDKVEIRLPELPVWLNDLIDSFNTQEDDESLYNRISDLLSNKSRFAEEDEFLHRESIQLCLTKWLSELRDENLKDSTHSEHYYSAHHWSLYFDTIMKSIQDVKLQRYVKAFYWWFIIFRGEVTLDATATRKNVEFFGSDSSGQLRGRQVDAKLTVVNETEIVVVEAAKSLGNRPTLEEKTDHVQIGRHLKDMLWRMETRKGHRFIITPGNELIGVFMMGTTAKFYSLLHRGYLSFLCPLPMGNVTIPVTRRSIGQFLGMLKLMFKVRLHVKELALNYCVCEDRGGAPGTAFPCFPTPSKTRRVNKSNTRKDGDKNLWHFRFHTSGRLFVGLDIMPSRYASNINLAQWVQEVNIESNLIRLKWLKTVERVSNQAYNNSII